MRERERKVEREKKEKDKDRKSDGYGFLRHEQVYVQTHLNKQLQGKFHLRDLRHTHIHTYTHIYIHTHTHIRRVLFNGQPSEFAVSYGQTCHWMY